MKKIETFDPKNTVIDLNVTTIEEIQKAFNYSSPSTARSFLKSMEKKGLLKIVPKERKKK